ncbi:hypothetical protein HYDPIDRAFT_187661 [Hydnomerulius pinastri MD-312]|uniref:SAP domain-containing protein n=1 Tax=Hydnomerulius pinastri MD-312 TaxID=994086 RepID=A0A0C9WG45_9AGAM|nr:hypothetical protein HYDPIDRAFT_187661 [Hydnomerulius pinastri MD-312]
MSTTTQILFNSPALHSLKRDQLVKLCKIHSLKANGKNKELIERLQLHAKKLPPDDPLNIATRSDNLDAKAASDSEDEESHYRGEGSSASSFAMARPSEQWEVVMDSIAEVDEDTLRSNRGRSNTQAGEFGTNASKASSVGSSLKVIATSLGLKRNNSKTDATISSSSSSLSSKDVAQSSSTVPTSDPTNGPEEPPVEPIPGVGNLQGLPAPANARLSLSQAPTTTTIRLVSTAPARQDFLLSPPKLKPFATSFDLIPGTPGGAADDGGPSVPVWPLSPAGAGRQSIYPSIPTFQGFGDLHKQDVPPSDQADMSDMDMDIDMPGGMGAASIHEPTPKKSNISVRLNTGATPKSTEKPSAQPVDIFSPAPKPQNASARSRLAIPRSEPFIFGSPLPQHNLSNRQFRSAAQSVLDDMNKRLAEEGVDGVDLDVLNNRQRKAEVAEENSAEKASLGVGDMFDKLHQQEFDKMDSIADHYAAKRGLQNKAPESILSKKRKSSLVVKERRSGVPAARHRPSGARIASAASSKKAVLPGGFGDEEEDEDEVVDRRMSKRPRVEREDPSEAEVEAPPPAKRVSLAPAPADPEEEARKQKEREAIRRKLDHAKAKRRSSMGRPSLVGRAPPPQKAKPSRFGFLSSAKSLVQNVWNRGAGSKAPTPNLPVARPAQPKEETKALPKAAPATKKSAVVPGSSGAPPVSASFGAATKRVPSGGSASGRPAAPGRSTLAPPVTSTEASGTVTSSRSARSPIPSFNGLSPSTAFGSRLSTVAGHGPSHGPSHSRSGSITGFSSMGSKAGISANASRVSSMGARSNIRASATSLQRPSGSIARSRTSSTLMAPTASSLAKANSHSRIPVSVMSHNENATLNRAGGTSKSQKEVASPLSDAALDQITNSPRSPARSPRPTKIFSQPLTSPAPRPPMSLTAAAASIVGPAAGEASSSKPPLPPKPKVLPGRRPRISRSKVIAKLASQRAAESSGGTEKAKGKTRSSMGAGVAGKTRQSHSGTRGDNVLMSAKKRARQSEYARRRSRAAAGESRAMDLD